MVYLKGLWSRTLWDQQFVSFVCLSMAQGSVSAEEVEAAFQKFAIYGDSKARGKEMNGKNFAKMCKDCHITDGKNVTTTDVDIVFSKVK